MILSAIIFALFFYLLIRGGSRDIDLDKYLSHYDETLLPDIKTPNHEERA